MIHKSGTVATFWQTSFVTAKNITDASAGNPTQAALSHALGASSLAAAICAGDVVVEAACSCRARNVHHAQNAQHAANTAKPRDHIAACSRESQYTSKKNG